MPATRTLTAAAALAAALVGWAAPAAHADQFCYGAEVNNEGNPLCGKADGIGFTCASDEPLSAGIVITYCIVSP